MKLLALGWRNLHNSGRSVTIAVEPLTLLLGENDAGKTTVLNLPALLLDGPTAGRWPSAGDHPEYAFEVRGTWADPGEQDITVVRGMGPDAGHYVTVGARRCKVAEAAKETYRIGGATWALSVADLMAATPAKRNKWLHETLVRDLWPTDKVREDLEANGLSPKLVAEAYGASAGYPPTPTDGQQLCRAVVEGLGQLDRENEGTIRSLRGAVDQAPGVAADLPTGTVADWRDRLAELDTEIAELERRAGAIEGARKGREAATAMRAAKERELDAVGVAELARKAEGALAVRTAANDTALRAGDEANAAARALVAAEADSAATKARASHADAEVTRLRTQEFVITRERGAARVLAELLGRCRVTMAAVRDALIRTDPTGELRKQLETLTAEIEALLVDTGETESVRLRVEAERERNALAEELKMAAQRVRAADMALDMAQLRNRTAVSTADKAERDYTAAIDLLNGSAARREAITAEIGKLREQLDTVDDVDGSAVVAGLTAARQRRLEVVRTIDVLNDATSDAARAEEHRARLALALERRPQIREGLRVAQMVRDRRASEELEVLLEPANQLLEPVAGCSLRFAGAELLMSSGGRSLTLDRASHSQRTAALLALYVAFVQRMRGWRVVILDDLEHLDRVRRTQLVTQLDDLIRAGKIDQAILAGVADGWEPPAGKTIRMRVQR